MITPTPAATAGDAAPLAPAPVGDTAAEVNPNDGLIAYDIQAKYNKSGMTIEFLQWLNKTLGGAEDGVASS